MTQPPQFALADQMVHIGKAGTIQGINVGHVVLPCFFQDQIVSTLRFFRAKQRLKNGTDTPKAGWLASLPELTTLIMQRVAMIEVISRDAIFAGNPEEVPNRFKLLSRCGSVNTAFRFQHNLLSMFLQNTETFL